MAARTAPPEQPAAPLSPPPAPDFDLTPAHATTQRPGWVSPAANWPTAWPTPQHDTTTSATGRPGPRRRGRPDRGMPMAPVLAAAGNASSLLATGAYEAGGVPAVAAAGAVVVAGTAAAVVRRRRTVRRNMATRNSRTGGFNQRGGGRGGSGSSGMLGLSGARPHRSATGSHSGPGTGSAGGRRPGGSAMNRAGGSGSVLGATGSHAGSRMGSGTRTPSPHTSGKHTPGGSGAATTLNAAARRANRAGKNNAPSRTVKALSAAGRGIATTARAGHKSAAATVKAAKTAGRSTRTAWNSTPGLAVRSATTKTRGVAADGLAALAAAAWTGLRKRDRHAALARLKDVWARRRAKRAAKNAPTSAAGTPGSQAPAAVAPAVRRPTATPAPASTTHTGGPAVSGHHFVAPAMEGARIAAAYDPTGMLQVGEDFAGLAEALRLHAEGMKVTVENADAKFPLDPRIVEIMRNIHSLQLKAAEMAEDLRPAFEQLHQVDLHRLRNPRKGAAGERMWDVSTNL